jgi:hypothetical protein
VVRVSDGAKEVEAGGTVACVGSDMVLWVDASRFDDRGDRDMRRWPFQLRYLSWIRFKVENKDEDRPGFSSRFRSS